MLVGVGIEPRQASQERTINGGKNHPFRKVNPGTKKRKTMRGERDLSENSRGSERNAENHRTPRNMRIRSGRKSDHLNLSREPVDPSPRRDLEARSVPSAKGAGPLSIQKPWKTRTGPVARWVPTKKKSASVLGIYQGSEIPPAVPRNRQLLPTDVAIFQRKKEKNETMRTGPLF